MHCSSWCDTVEIILQVFTARVMGHGGSLITFDPGGFMNLLAYKTLTWTGAWTSFAFFGKKATIG